MASDGSAITKHTPVKLQDMIDECIMCNVPLHVNYLAADLHPMERAWVRMICRLIGGPVKEKQMRCAPQCASISARAARLRGYDPWLHHMDRAQRKAFVAIANNMSLSTRKASTQGVTASSSEIEITVEQFLKHAQTES